MTVVRSGSSATSSPAASIRARTAEIDAFEAMEREGDHGRERGFFVAFSYSRDAENSYDTFEFSRKNAILASTTR